MTPKQVQLDIASYCYRTKCDGWRLVHRIYCSAHQTSINNVFWAVAFKTCFFCWFVPHHDLSLIMKTCLIIHNGRRRLSKNKATGWMGTIREAAASETLIWANSCNKHTIKLYGSISLTLFLSYNVIVGLTWEEEDLFCKQTSPWRGTVQEKYGLLY